MHPDDSKENIVNLPYIEETLDDVKVVTLEEPKQKTAMQRFTAAVTELVLSACFWAIVICGTVRILHWLLPSIMVIFYGTFI